MPSMRVVFRIVILSLCCKWAGLSFSCQTLQPCFNRSGSRGDLLPRKFSSCASCAHIPSVWYGTVHNIFLGLILWHWGMLLLHPSWLFASKSSSVLAPNGSTLTMWWHFSTCHKIWFSCMNCAYLKYYMGIDMLAVEACQHWQWQFLKFGSIGAETQAAIQCQMSEFVENGDVP